MRIVIDTNVFVSALISPSGKPASVLNLALGGSIVPVADALIFAEYFDV
ncbi:MAG: PIN domain-containing protein, partial [Synergistaceae bacterium]|nr:PIN domain-containing protein [Synergistaceae bacterium]